MQSIDEYDLAGLIGNWRTHMTISSSAGRILFSCCVKLDMLSGHMMVIRHNTCQQVHSICMQIIYFDTGESIYLSICICFLLFLFHNDRFSLVFIVWLQKSTPECLRWYVYYMQGNHCLCKPPFTNSLLPFASLPDFPTLSRNITEPALFMVHKVHIWNLASDTIVANLIWHEMINFWKKSVTFGYCIC